MQWQEIDKLSDDYISPKIGIVTAVFQQTSSRFCLAKLITAFALILHVNFLSDIVGSLSNAQLFDNLGLSD
jgi:hypothetical protein